MAVKVNLLPAESRVGKDLARVLKITRMLGVISIAVFIVFVLAIGAYFIFCSSQLSSLIRGNDDLKTQVLALKASENKIMLLKDRIGKIKMVQNTPSAIKNLDGINSVIALLTTESTVNELDVSSGKVLTSVNFKSNDDLDNFIKNLSTSKVFKTVSLSSFSFSPVSGYLVSIAIAGIK